MNGYTPAITNDTKLGNIIERLMDAAGLVDALEIAWCACELTEEGDTDTLVRELDFQTRMIENEKHEAALNWDKMTGDYMDGAAFDRAEIKLQGRI